MSTPDSKCADCPDLDSRIDARVRVILSERGDGTEIAATLKAMVDDHVHRALRGGRALLRGR